jgi:hypothetical protein
LSATSVDQRKQERLARLILSAPVSGVVPRAEQQGRQLAAAADAEFGVRPVQVVVDGAHGDPEALGDAAAGQATWPAWRSPARRR